MAKLFLGTREVTPVIPFSSGKYQLLQRIKDDTNTEIGTVSGFVKNSNDTEYAVVCLDAQYRTFGQFLSARDAVNIPNLNNWVSSYWYSAKQTATENCDTILAFCNTNNYTSSGVSNCRTVSFTIGGVTYQGQLPTIRELFDITTHRAEIETLDTTATSYPSYNFSTARNCIVSSVYSGQYIFFFNTGGRMTDAVTTQSGTCVTVLELPNSL